MLLSFLTTRPGYHGRCMGFVRALAERRFLAIGILAIVGIHSFPSGVCGC